MTRNQLKNELCWLDTSHEPAKETKKAFQRVKVAEVTAWRSAEHPDGEKRSLGVWSDAVSSALWGIVAGAHF